MALKSSSDALKSAKRTLTLEAESLQHLAHSIDARFASVVKRILKSKGRLIVTGIGKSGNIAQKIVATLVSTGQPAVFMHAADAIHGDLGTIQKHDIVLCISKSGDSPEIKVLVPLVKSLGNPLVAMVSNTKSFLHRHADEVLFVPVEREACPNNLAPTVSTTAQLAMGDALAVVLMEQRGFTSSDFARVHPGGALGKKLYTKVSDLLGQNSAPVVTPKSPIKKVIVEISSKRLGATAVVDNKHLVGVITDGDIRRMLEKASDIKSLTAAAIMGKSPKTIDAASLAVEAFQLMEKHNITTLVVMSGEQYKGIIHLHDILKEGIF
jgi:arabinose-5-phosphate isomerase